MAERIQTTAALVLIGSAMAVSAAPTGGQISGPAAARDELPAFMSRPTR